MTPIRFQDSEGIAGPGNLVLSNPFTWTALDISAVLRPLAPYRHPSETVSNFHRWLGLSKYPNLSTPPAISPDPQLRRCRTVPKAPWDQRVHKSRNSDTFLSRARNRNQAAFHGIIEDESTFERPFIPKT